MTSRSILFLQLTAVVLLTQAGAALGDCLIDLHAHVELTVGQALVMRPLPYDGDLHDFLLPTSSDASVSVATGSTVRFACPTTTLVNYPRLRVVETSCVDAQTFAYMGDVLEYPRDLRCAEQPTSAIGQEVANCNNGIPGFSLLLIPVLFENESPVAPTASTVMEVCFDTLNGNPLFSRVDLISGAAGHQVGFPPPPAYISEPNYYGGISPQDKYDNQLAIVAAQIGAASNNYINANNNLSVGHLTAYHDLAYGTLQHATYYFINTAPMWHTVDTGNWKNIGDDIRRRENGDLILYSGTNSALLLPDLDGVAHLIYLQVDAAINRMQVPGYFWKVSYDPVTRFGVAIVVVNNPYVDDVPETGENVFCPGEDVCNRISWLGDWNREDVTAGLVFCCEVDTFRKEVTTLPRFTTDGLLTN